MSSPINSLAYALVSALARDLKPHLQPVYEYRRETGKSGTARVDTGKMQEVRPREHQCEIFHFPQTWGSTALGFGGLGGQAITTAYTTVVYGPQGDACVYFDGRLAYHIESPNAQLRIDVSRSRVAAVSECFRYSLIDHDQSTKQSPIIGMTWLDDNGKRVFCADPQTYENRFGEPLPKEAQGVLAVSSIPLSLADHTAALASEIQRIDPTNALAHDALAEALNPFMTNHLLPQVALLTALKDMVYAFGTDEDSWFEESCELDLSNDEYDARRERSIRNAELVIRAVRGGELVTYFQELQEKASKYDESRGIETIGSVP